MVLLVASALAVVGQPAPPAGANGPEPPQCIEPACPDLVLNLVAVDTPAHVRRGRPRTAFVIEIANVGTAPARDSRTLLTLSVIEGGVPRVLDSIERWTPALLPGHTHQISASVPGTFDLSRHCLQLAADARGQVAESDENNILSLGACH
jgi:hypothetical protein